MPVNPVRAFHCGPFGCNEFAVGAATGADNLPAGNIVPQGTYNVFGVSVDMTGEGLYRVSDFAGQSVQVITFAGDIETLISAIGWMSQTGYSDGVTYGSGFQTTVRSRNLSTSCGATAGLAQTIMAQCGIMTRSVGGLATGLPLNSYDNGHTIAEVWFPSLQKWVAVDFLMKYFFENSSHDLINMLEMHDIVYGGGVLNLRSFGPPVGAADAGGNQYLWLHHAILTNPTAWYAKSFQIPYIQNGYAYQAMYENAAQQALIPQLGGYQALSRSSWVATFYGNTLFSEPPHPTTKAGWGALTTMFDPGLFLLPGSTLTSIGATLDSAQSVEFKVLQKISANVWKAVAGCSFSHPGGTASQSISFAVPSTGVYVPSIAANPPGAEAFSVIGVRDYVSGNLAVNSQATFNRVTNGAICLRYTVA